ncbi:MAG: DUF721 domain-containing protein [Candidatus Dormibacteraceae bacterium]
MHKLGNLLPKVLAKQPNRGRLAELHVQALFRTVVGENLASSCDVVELHGSVLTIMTGNPALAHQLRLDSEELLARINAVWSGRPLREVRVRTGRAGPRAL